ncbi:MAG: hypothetical protein HC896_02780 [Bacteroidales bacterium]|nr:hypothetical protein [Bacteroidales bacterium]
MKAYNHVRFFRSNIQGKCDSMVYLSQDSVVQMFDLPVMWSEEKQVTAAFIQFFIEESGIDYMEIKNAAFIVMEEDTTKYNQISGKDMYGYFKDNALYRIDVMGNGQSIYYPKDDGANEVMAMNKSVCSDMRIYVTNNAIEKIVFLTKTRCHQCSPLRRRSAARSHIKRFFLAGQP